MKEKNQGILFVCLGNICRSPLAEGIMHQTQTRFNLQFRLDSAGTSAFHTGEAPDPRTVANALKNNLDISHLRARPFVAGDLEKFEKIFVMDRNNLNTIAKAHPHSVHLSRLSLLPHPERNQEFVEIPDPYYGNENDFEHVFQLLSKSIFTLCRELSKTN